MLTGQYKFINDSSDSCSGGSAILRGDGTNSAVVIVGFVYSGDLIGS